MIPANLNGVIVVDKPANISSARVVTIVRQALRAGKTGHAGTLDPFAEGILVCCVNQATRLASFLLRGKKKYNAVLKLGEETDTQDLTGKVVANVKTVDVSAQRIKAVFRSFLGPIEQLPPVYSALKHKGVPLYKLARRGQPVQKPPRRVHIYENRIQEIDLPYVRFEVACSHGTYIRTLSADIGSSLGCGGHLYALKRVESSGFTLNQATPLSALEELAQHRSLTKKLISMRDALPDMPEIYADSDLAAKIRYGQQLTKKELIDLNGRPGPGKAEKYLKIVDQEEDLIAIVEQNKIDERLKYCCVFPKRSN